MLLLVLVVGVFFVVPGVAIFLLVWDIRDARLRRGKEGPRGFDVVRDQR